MRTRTGIMLVIFFAALDQLSKYWVEKSLPFQETIAFIPFLSWFRTYNEGIAFSFFSSFSQWVLIALTVTIIIFVLWLWKQSSRENFFTRLGYALVIGGAIGNLIDRAALGYVIDFVQFHTSSWSFAIFNVADSFITVGAAIIIFDEMFGGRQSAPDNISNRHNP